jgi:hypothetical protein
MKRWSADQDKKRGHHMKLSARRTALVAILATGPAMVALAAGSAPAGASSAPGTIVAVAGTVTAGTSGDGGPATSAQLSSPEDVAQDAAGNLYIGDDGTCRVRKVSASGIITKIAGGTCGAETGIGGPANAAHIGDADGIAVDAHGNVYFSDSINHNVLKVNPAGIISVFAGTGVSGNTGDNGAATSAKLNDPWGVRVDRAGNVYISDSASEVVRKVDTSGIITTVVGTGSAGYTGDNGPAIHATLHDPRGIWIDSSGNMFITDLDNEVIRKVTSAGIISTVAGNGTAGTSGNGGPATSAQLDGPYGVTEDIAGNLYIANYDGDTVQKVTKSTGKISVIAGNGTNAETGNNGPASNAELDGPSQVWVDSSGNLLINDYNGSVIRKIVLVQPTGQGYWLVASDGGIFTEGNAVFYGSTGAIHLNKPIVGMAATPDGMGYWLVATDGGIFTEGDAVFYGSTGAIHLNKPIVGMAATPDGKGYWLVASDGGIFAFGDAVFYGSTGNIVLNKPIVGMAATPTGQGYWLVASDGGIFTEGDAAFFGSTGSIALNKPIVGMAATPDGMGYWLVASDGGIFTEGDAVFYGSTGAIHLNKPIVGMAATPDGMGYWLVASDGGIFTEGDAMFFGSTGGIHLNQPIVGMAAGL